MNSLEARSLTVAALKSDGRGSEERVRGGERASYASA